MNEFETTWHIMKVNGLSYDELAEKLGQSNPGNLYNALNKNKNIMVSTLRKILDALGYELVIREKGKDRGGYVIDDSDTPSPLRFHGMSMDFGVDVAKKIINLPRPERLRLTEELKGKIGVISLAECENRLFDIWCTVNPVHKNIRKINQYDTEYEKYRREFRILYESK